MSKKQLTINITGKVVHGDHYGKVLGFPTANIDRRDFVRQKLKVKLGIWAGVAEVDRKNYKSGIVIGPTDVAGLPKIEAHLIGFKGNLYGKKMSLLLIKFVRKFKNYKTVEDLKLAIKKDVEKIKKIKLL